MNTRIRDEKELLDQGLRKRIIEEIKGSENVQRKEEAYKRYMIYKDFVQRYVLKELLKQFKSETVTQMSYTMSNINITKKIIDKLSRVYSNGVKRDAGEKEKTQQVEEVARMLKLNQRMKKVNRYTKLQRNCALHICPSPVMVNNQEKYEIQARVLQPFFYDVIENYYDREKPMCYITSSFRSSDGNGQLVSLTPQTDGRSTQAAKVTPAGDGKDQMIADTPSDQGLGEQETYVWWSKSFHFTTDKDGNILDGGPGFNKANPINPIQRLPFIEFAIDQDGAFWSIGGSDITDGTVLVNSMITNVNHVGVIQGYGQMWMKGKGLPKGVTVGPTNVILLEYTKEDPDPSFGFATSSPPLDELKGQIEMYIALLLTTNNLSTSGVSAQLAGGSDFAAGIALMIDKAESLEDVEDQRQMFIDAEPEVFRIYSDWQRVYGSKNLLTDAFKALPIDENTEITTRFNDARPIMSESEKLDNLTKRKELGINLMVELIMMDDPSLTQEEAEEKLKKVTEENMRRMQEAVNNAAGVDDDESDEGDGGPGPDGDKPGPGVDGDPKEDPEADQE